MWAEPAVATPPARMRRDEGLAGGVLVAAGIETLTRVAPGWRPAAVVLGCVLAVAVLIRQTRPLTAVGLAFGTIVVLDLAALVLGVDQLFLYTGAIVLVLLHSLYRWGSGREAVLGGALAAVALTVSVGVESTDAGD